MRSSRAWALVLSACLVAGCTAVTHENPRNVAGITGITANDGSSAVEPARRREAAQPAIAALQRGSFEEAGRLAKEVIATDANNSYARLVSAVAHYEKTNHQLALDFMTVVIGGLGSGSLNQRYLRTTFQDAESELAVVEADLAAADTDPDLAVELCIACWKVDWNADGRVNRRDQRLFEIEVDANGNEIDEEDPRRRPTFRFDHGDIAWARAFVSFERAALDVLLAYDWTELGRITRLGDEDKIVVRLVDKDRIAKARTLILEGLAHSDATRRAYLAETDDDREWVPNPRQKSYSMPLPVDQALYDTWEGVLGDVRRLIEEDEGLSVADLLKLAEVEMKHPPSGYVAIGRMLSNPKDIVIEVGDIERLDRGRETDAALRNLLGSYHVQSMKPSPLPRRLLRMKGEIDRGEEEMDRKLRYLLWLN